MKTINKPFFFGSYLVAIVIATILINGAVIAGGGTLEQEYLPIVFIGYMFSLYSGVILFILFYKMWQAIPPPFARTTPGKAVGFLFIPIFQIYWLFQVIWGWSKDWNSFASKSEVKLLGISEKLALSVSIFWVINLAIGQIANFLHFPVWLTVILSISSSVLMLIFIFKVCDLLNMVPNLPDEDLGVSPPGLQQTWNQSRSIACLILSIVSLLGLFLPNLWGILFGPICSIVAIFLARKQRKIFREPLATAGLIIGIIGAVLWGIVVIVFIVLIFSAYG